MLFQGCTSVISIVISVPLNGKVPLLQQFWAGMAGFGSQNGFTFKAALTHPCLGHLCELSKCTTAISPAALGGSAPPISWNALQGQLCLLLDLPWDWESCNLHRDFPSAQLPKVSAGAVQTGTAQLCLDEWLAFKTQSTQGPWQTASKDVCFDFSHL